MSVDAKKDRERVKGGDAAQMEALAELRNSQRDIVAFRHRCDRQIDEIERSYAENVRPHLERRSVAIRSVPGFWSKTVLNHPLLSTVFEPGESEVLGYLTNLEVDEDPLRPDYFKIHFSFRKNPFFENRTLTKEFTESGSTNTVLRWRKGQRFPKVTQHEPWKDDDLGLEYKGFFRWFLDPNEHYCDPIADILKSCIWYNPLEFYDERTGKDSKDERKSRTSPES